MIRSVILGMVLVVGCIDTPDEVIDDPITEGEGEGESCGLQTENGMQMARRLPPPPPCNCDRMPWPCCCDTPIILDIAGDGIKLTSPKNGVVFEFRDNKFGPWSWTTENSDDAWLVRDNSGEGLIEHGSELFSSVMPQPLAPEGASHGFNALKYQDKNEDGVVNADDPVWSTMRLWQDKNHDGKSQEQELHSLEELGVAGLSTKYESHSDADGCGNVYRYSAQVIPAQGSTVNMTAWDVLLASATGSSAIKSIVREPPHPNSWRAKRLRFKAAQEERRRKEGANAWPFRFHQAMAGGPLIICPYFFEIYEPSMTSGTAFPPPTSAKVFTKSFWWWQKPVPHPVECTDLRSAELITHIFQETGIADRLVGENTVLSRPTLTPPLDDGTHRCVASVPQCYRNSGIIISKLFYGTADTRVVGLSEIPTENGFSDTVLLPCNAIPTQGCTNLEEPEEQ